MPDYTDSWLGSLLAGCGEAAGMVSVLAVRAASEGPRSTRAVETTPAASLGDYWGPVSISARRNSSHSPELSSIKGMEGCVTIYDMRGQRRDCAGLEDEDCDG